MKHKLVGIVWSCMFWLIPYLMLSNITLAGTLIQKNDAQIVLLSKKYSDEPQEKATLKKQWNEICQRLATLLTVGKGVYRQGILEKVRCEDPVKVMSEIQLDSTFRWLIVLRDLEDKALIDVFYVDLTQKSKIFRHEGKLVFHFSQKLLSFLADEEAMQLTSLGILDQLPFARWMDMDNERSGFVVEGPSHLPPPPDTYIIYAAEFSRKLEVWIPRVIGYARRQRINSQKPGDRQLNPNATATQSKDQVISYRYEMAIDEGKILEGVSYWAQDANGRNQNQRVLQDFLVNQMVDSGFVGFFTNLFLDSLTSNYFGIRYGFPLVRNDSLAEKSSIVGLLAEIRNGPLGGLRWNWDFAPKVEETVNGESYFFTWSRASLGWSFDLQLPEILAGWFNRVDVQPKIGLMDFESKVRVFNIFNGSEQAASFQAKNSLDFGIEVGLEYLTPWSLFRVWGATNISGLIPQQGTSLSTSSQRAGLDSYIDFWQIGSSTKSSLLIFTAFERLELEKSASEVLENSEEGELAVQGLSLDLIFFGLGLTLSW